MEQLEDASEVYYDYVCRSLSFGVPHPSEIAEPRGLSTISLPEPTYPLRDALDNCNIIDSGKLSSLQLEGVQYACQRHQLMLAGGTRAGFFLGDGAGVGKGRQIAGLVRNGMYLPPFAAMPCIIHTYTSEARVVVASCLFAFIV